MKNEETAGRVEALFGQLVEALRAGSSDALRAYLETAARFTRYSFNNVCLICAQRPDATRVAGYQAWKQVGRQVRRGERGLMIIAPIVYRDRNDISENADADAQGRRLVGFRAVHVFDISQTEGADPPNLEREGTGDPAGYLPALRDAIQRAGIRLEYSTPLDGSTLGEPRSSLIVIASGLPPVDELSALAREFAHELLHKGSDRPTSRTVRETEAEAVAYIVCHAIGVEAGVPSADYIGLYGGDATLLLQSLERVQTTATRILREVGFERSSSPGPAA